MRSTFASPNSSAVSVGESAPLTLLVLTNFFSAARRAIHYAAGLAAPIGARLVLLHVRAAPVPEGELLPQLPAPDADLRVAVQALAVGTAVPTAVELVPDLQLRTAAGLARRFGPALFVLGRAAASVRENEVSAAVRDLLRGGSFPLLMVPETYHGSSSPMRVVVAADSEPFVLDHPAAALQLLAQLQPVLTVVTVEGIEDDQACAAALRHVKASGLTTGANYTTLLAVRHLNLAQGLLTAIDQTDAQLLVLVARQHSFLDEMCHCSVMSRLLAESPVPLLVLPAMDN